MCSIIYFFLTLKEEVEQLLVWCIRSAEERSLSFGLMVGYLKKNFCIERSQELMIIVNFMRHN